MAKPLSEHSAGCSTSSTRPLYTTASRRRRKTPSLAPSGAVLTFLGTISASLPPVQGSPAPPSFLCPSYITEVAPSPTTQTRPTSPPSPRRVLVKKSVDASRNVPDKFELTDNGRWRRVDTYTLYGSTVCLSCEDTTTTTTSFDDQIQIPASSSIPISTASTTSTYSISLPPGWQPKTTSNSGRTTLILALSLVLAFAICFLIISCTFWRKKKRRKRRQNDVEMKARKRRKESVDEEDRVSILTEKEVKVKQRVWARATARWKANAKYSARQRRGKRHGLSTRMNSPRSSCASLEDNQISVPQIPPSPSPALSRRSSLVSLYAVSGTSMGQAAVVHSSPEEGEESRGSILLSTSHTPPSSPPAYHHDGSAPHSMINGIGGESPVYGSTSLNLNPPYSSSHDLLGKSNFSAPHVHAAHVATDDKTLLARMADLASAPPLDGADSLHSVSTSYHISVPTWQDEELEDFGDLLHGSATCRFSPPQPSSPPRSPTPLFPPPPSKGKMAAPAFYDYPYTFDDILVEPDPGPSAPPFEEESKPLDATGLAPSAPPLSDAEPASYGDTYPSAPPHEW